MLWDGSVFPAASLAALGSQAINEQYPRDGSNNQSFVRFEPFAAAFHNDITAPTSVITIPAASGYYSTTTLTTLSGTSYDSGTPASDVNAVAVQVERQSDNQCWRGTSAAPASSNWGSCPYYVPASGKTPWTISITYSTNVWSDGINYILTSTASDKVGNISSPATVSFYYDNSPASATITFPLSTGPTSGYYLKSALGSFAGVVLDTTPVPSGFMSGINQIRLALRRTTDNRWWTGSAWQVAQTYFSTTSYNTGTGVWGYSMPSRYTNLDDATTYFLSVQVQDTAGNWMLRGSTMSFVVDESSPTVGLTTPGTDGGSYQFFSTIRGTAADPNGFALKVTSISISNPGVGCWDGISAFTQSCPYYLTVTGTSTWSYDFPTSSFDGSNLSISVKSQSVAGYVTSPVLTQSFIIDG